MQQATYSSLITPEHSTDGDTFIVLDAFPLPVQGTETRVNAGNEGNEFAVQYMEGSNAVRPSCSLCV